VELSGEETEEEKKLKAEISKLNRKRKERNEAFSRGGLTILEQRRLKFINTGKMSKKEREQMVTLSLFLSLSLLILSFSHLFTLF
jgi:hypothetical protein